MSQKLKKEYLENIKIRYGKANKKQKTAILNEFCLVCGYTRKHAIKKLSKKTKKINKSKNKPGPKIVYDQNIIIPLSKLWLDTGQICSKRLVAAIPLWLPFYDNIESDIKLKLLSIKPATIDRKLKPTKAKFKTKGLCGTKPGTLLKQHIPIRTDNYDITKPGFLEADTVAHCGKSLEGDFVWSLTMTDIYSHWTEIRATWGKGSTGVIENIKDIERCLPFTLLGFDSDNGSEFLNWHLLRYLVTDRKVQPVLFSRSREYKKNDNAHVEQKNWTHVRQLFGYDRFDNQVVVKLMNNVYSKEWSNLQNFFLPTMKLLSKERINSKNVKHHEPLPKTPYQRLLDSPDISDTKKQDLIKTFSSLNPRFMKKSLERKLKLIFSIATVSSIVSHSEPSTVSF